MQKQTEINDAQIRAESVRLEEVAQEALNRARVFGEIFDALYPNLEFADPVKHAAFDRLMITLARAKSLCECLPSLAYQAKEMQLFGKQQLAEEVARINQAENLRRARPGVEPLTPVTA